MAMCDDVDAAPKERRILVVTRLLKAYGLPVVTHVEFAPDFPGNNGSAKKEEKKYIDDCVERIKSEFCSHFVEFTEALWFGSIHTALD